MVYHNIFDHHHKSDWSCMFELSAHSISKSRLPLPNTVYALFPGRIRYLRQIQGIWEICYLACQYVRSMYAAKDHSYKESSAEWGVSISRADIISLANERLTGNFSGNK